jgi:ferritin-like metal-binding protein YciE
MENSAVDRNQTRMSETPIPLVKQQLQYHLEQTFEQQDRLRSIITNLGGQPHQRKGCLANAFANEHGHNFKHSQRDCQVTS